MSLLLLRTARLSAMLLKQRLQLFDRVPGVACLDGSVRSLIHYFNRMRCFRVVLPSCALVSLLRSIHKRCLESCTEERHPLSVAFLSLLVGLPRVACHKLNGFRGHNVILETRAFIRALVLRCEKRRDCDVVGEEGGLVDGLDLSGLPAHEIF